MIWLNLDGDDYVSIGEATDFDFYGVQDFTIEAWVYPTIAAVDMQIISKGYDGTNTQWGHNITE